MTPVEVSAGGADPALASALERARAACAEAAARLASTGIEPDALAEYVPPRTILLVTRKATMRPAGEAWRLGTVLLATDGALFAHGHTTRSAERGRPGYQSTSREERREIAAAALRGGYPVGTTVNYDAVPLPLTASIAEPRSPEDELPIGYRDGEIRIRWRAGAPLEGAQPLAAYLRERVGLLTDPTHGAGS